MSDILRAVHDCLSMRIIPTMPMANQKVMSSCQSLSTVKSVLFRVWESLTIQQHAHKYVTQVRNLFSVQKQDTNKIRTKYDKFIRMATFSHFQ